MEEIKREFFEQIRLDGKKYYYATVTFKVGYLFFGLIPLTIKKYLSQGWGGSYFLSKYKSSLFPVDSLENAKVIIEYLIKEEIKDYNRREIISYNKVE